MTTTTLPVPSPSPPPPPPPAIRTVEEVEEDVAAIEQEADRVDEEGRADECRVALEHAREDRRAQGVAYKESAG